MFDCYVFSFVNLQRSTYKFYFINIDGLICTRSKKQTYSETPRFEKMSKNK